MRYLRCKCGKRSAWSSMGVPECDGCPDCKTTLEESAALHREPLSHDWREKFTIDAKTGVRGKLRQCQRCYASEPVLFKFFVNDTEFRVSEGDATGGQIRCVANVELSVPLFRVNGTTGPLGDNERVSLDADPAFWCDASLWTPPTAGR